MTSGSPTPGVTLTRPQIESWLESTGDYGMDGVWTPTREAFEALCKLGLSALSESAAIVQVLPLAPQPATITTSTHKGGWPECVYKTNEAPGKRAEASSPVPAREGAPANVAGNAQVASPLSATRTNQRGGDATRMEDATPVRGTDPNHPGVQEAHLPPHLCGVCGTSRSCDECVEVFK